MAERYCKPWNAGLASETPAVARRIGRLLETLDTEINGHVCEGQILDDVRNFRMKLCTALELDGWTFSYDGGNKMKVRAPGHKQPFTKHYTGGE